MSVLSAAALDRYSAPLQQPYAREKLAARTGWPSNTAALYLDAVCGEARTGFRLLEWAGLQGGHRVLEVGAGGGLLTGYLQSCGIAVTAIEPAESGFEATPKLAELVSEMTGVTARIEPLSAHQIDRRRHGAFDLIFSINVIEHFQPMKENLDALAAVMEPNGLQAHTCPNYHVPYEPHYGIALLPVAPQLTPYLGLRRLAAENVWQSLNFITSSDVRDYATRHGLSIRFKQGALGEALERLCDEPEFAARHPRVLRNMARLTKTVGLTGALKRLPSSWMTPMTFVLRRGQCGSI